MKKNYKPILWTITGALISLFILLPLVIALLQYDEENHSKPINEVIISAYKYFLWKIDYDSVLAVLIFLIVGGVIGHLLYYLKTTLSHQKKNVSITDLLANGESETVEFKSSLRWDFRQQKTNKELEFTVLKTITAFMNTSDGILLIGVADDGSAVGLENDLRSLKKKDIDGFEQHLMELVALNIGTDYCRNIHVSFSERQGNDICVVAVSHIKIPVFLKYQQHTFFYVRTGNHTRELDIQEAINYIKT
ncbi:MAG TPA: ATP-binding protein [Bacteroidia bacterium]|nr:ATP-binding protein [Bacteroidia bacterium]